MPVLMIGGSDELTPEGYAEVMGAMRPVFEQAPGLVMHLGHERADGRLQVLEVWETKEASDRFFVAHVRPNLPSGVHPKRQTMDIVELVLPRR